MIKKISINKTAQEPIAQSATPEQLLKVLEPLLQDLDAAIRSLRGTGPNFKALEAAYPDIVKYVNKADVNNSINVLKNTFATLTNWKLQLRG